MQAIVLGPHGLHWEPDCTQPRPSPGETLVRVSMAGICETDLQIIRGYMGFQGILGHEFVGIAEGGRFDGQRVVGEINCSCLQCSRCRAGLAGHCRHRTVLGILGRDGAFAEWVQLPDVNLHRVPDEVSTHLAVFTEPLAAAFQIPAQVPLERGQRTIVLGDGRLGNLCAQVLHLHGCRVAVVGKHAHKLALLERRGIATMLLEDLSPRRAADVVVECTGAASGLPLALQLVQPRGTVVMKTTVAAEHALSLASVVIDEIRLVGSRCGPFPRALEALKNREVEVEPLIEVVYPLNRGLEALERAQQPSTLKILLAVGETGTA